MLIKSNTQSSGSSRCYSARSLNCLSLSQNTVCQCTNYRGYHVSTSGNLGGHYSYKQIASFEFLLSSAESHKVRYAAVEVNLGSLYT